LEAPNDVHLARCEIAPKRPANRWAQGDLPAAPRTAEGAARAQHTPPGLPQPARPSKAAVARMRLPLWPARACERPSRPASSGTLGARRRQRVRR